MAITLMILLGILLLFTGVALIWFRTPLTGTSLVDDDIPFSIYMVNHSGETTLLWIGGLLAVLGIGLTLVDAAKSNPRTGESSDIDPCVNYVSFAFSMASNAYLNDCSIRFVYPRPHVEAVPMWNAAS